MSPPAGRAVLDGGRAAWAEAARPGYERSAVGPRMACYRPLGGGEEQTFAQAVAAGLGRGRGGEKSLSPRFFYDDRGSELFERICELPEYYLTRLEAGLLERAAPEIAEIAGPGARLVELGSGSSCKTRLILDALARARGGIEYVPIDVSDTLARSCACLLDDYPGLRVTGVIDTYQGGLEFAGDAGGGARTLIAFLGSSIGNLDGGAARDLLRRVRRAMRGGGDAFLAGMDLVKDRGILERAYDDSRGVTAQFNLNVLRRINRELGGEFDPAKFAHVAAFNESERRVEMRLRSLEDQAVAVRGLGITVELSRGETIHTESSHKYDLPQIRGMMAGAGLSVRRVWSDPRGHYALVLCSAAP